MTKLRITVENHTFVGLRLYVLLEHKILQLHTQLYFRSNFLYKQRPLRAINLRVTAP